MVGNSKGSTPQFLRRVHNRPTLRRRSRLLALARLVLVAGGMALGGFVGYASFDAAVRGDTFALRQIILKDVPVALVEPVKRRLNPIRGSNLLTLDLDVVRAQLETIPQIDSVGVRRLLPDRIEVFVHERIPEANLIADDLTYLVDKDAVILHAVDRPSRGLPHIRLSRPLGDLPARDHRLPDSLPEARWLEDALHTWEWLLETPREPLPRIQYARLDPEGVVLVASEGRFEILLGDANSLDTKLLNFAALLQGQLPTGPNQVDLRFRDQVILRPIREPVFVEESGPGPR